MSPAPLPSPTAHPSPPVPRLPRVVTWAVAAMVIVQFLQWTVVTPEDVQALLGFRRANLEVGRWWTALTYPLVHQDFSLLLLNAYVLVLCGARVERLWGSGRFLAFLLLSGLGGWALHLFVGGTGSLLGASAAAFAVLAVYAGRWGADVHEIAGGLPVPGRWLAVFVGGAIVLVGLGTPVGGGIGFLAHLGGVGAAWLFLHASSVMFVERMREGMSAMPDDPPEDQPPRAVPRTLPRSRARERETIDDVVSRTNATAPRQAAPRRRASAEAVAPPPSIDAILDKISAEGIERLTDEERRMLVDHSRRLRNG